MVVMQPGDWLCKCGTYSPRDTDECTNCAAPRGSRKPLEREPRVLASVLVVVTMLVVLGATVTAIAVLGLR